MAPVYSTVITYSLVGCTSIYCLSHFTKTISMSIASYSTILVHSIIGAVKYWEESENADTAFKNSLEILSIFAFPGIVSTLWLQAGPKPEIAYIHFGVSFVPFILYLLDKTEEKLNDAILMLNFLSCLYISVTTSNWAALATAGSAAVIYAINKNGDEVGGLRNVDACNVAAIGFCVASLHAIAFAGAITVIQLV